MQHGDMLNGWNAYDPAKKHRRYGYPPVIKYGNGPLISDCSMKMSMYRGFSIAMFDSQRVEEKMILDDLGNLKMILVPSPCIN